MNKYVSIISGAVCIPILIIFVLMGNSCKQKGGVMLKDVVGYSCVGPHFERIK